VVGLALPFTHKVLLMLAQSVLSPEWDDSCLAQLRRPSPKIGRFRAFSSA
jgi:hypothetical protein